MEKKQIEEQLIALQQGFKQAGNLPMQGYISNALSLIHLPEDVQIKAFQASLAVLQSYFSAPRPSDN